MMQKQLTWLLQEKYHGEKTAGFFADCERLAQGEPLAYVIGYVPFLACTIWLNSRPLIPRPETEFWVEKALAVIGSHPTSTSANERPAAGGFGWGDAGASESRLGWGREARTKETVSSHPVFARSILAAEYSPKLAERPFAQINEGAAPPRVLDLCAGSGAIGVAVAKALPEARVTFAELDPAHLPTITKNLTENTTIYSSNNYVVFESDLFAQVEGVFDFILTNPPYIDAAADTVDDSVTAHEPHLALFGGSHGLEIIERIISEANARITPQGQLWIEHEPFQCEPIATLGAKHLFSVTHHPDQYGTLRYSILTAGVAK